MNVKFSEVRIEMHDRNTHLGRVNNRLGTVEGDLRIPTTTVRANGDLSAVV